MGQLWGRFAPRLPHIMMILSNGATTSVQGGAGHRPVRRGVLRNAGWPSSVFVRRPPGCRSPIRRLPAKLPDAGAFDHGKVVRNDLLSDADAGAARVRPARHGFARLTVGNALCAWRR